MFRVVIEGVEQLVEDATYKAEIHGKLSHVNKGWEPSPEEEAPKFAPASPSVFAETGDAQEPSKNNLPEEAD